MPQITFDVRAVVTGIRIDATARRLVLEGVLQDTASGETVRTFSEDVADALTAAQRANVIALVTRAQTWVDAKMGG